MAGGPVASVRAIARICVIRQFYFPLDTRVRREVHTLADAGYEVDVICMRRAGEPRLERNGRVTVRRLPLEHRRGGVGRYLFEYGVFMLLAGFAAGALHLRRRYDVVQVNSIPDTLVFAAAVPRLLGARVLLDLHECMPEFFATKFRTGMRQPAVRAIALLEQASIGFADGAVTCTQQMHETFVRRGATRTPIDVVLNSSDEAIFDPRRYPPRPRDGERFVLVCHGAIEERYGLDNLIEAAALLRERCPGLEVEIYGEGSYRDVLRRLAAERGVADRVRFSDGFAPIEDLLRAIADADAGVVAMKRDAFRDLTHCNKMFDFIAMRKPAIVSRTRSVEAYFDESSFEFFTAGDAHDLARAISALYDDRGRGERLADHAVRVSERYRWQHQRQVYLGAVRRLAGERADGRRRRLARVLPGSSDGGAPSAERGGERAGDPADLVVADAREHR